MSQLKHLDDIGEEGLPQIPGPQGGLRQAADAAQNATRADRHPHSPRPPSVSIPMTTLKRTGTQSSGAAHVDIGHFDPQGVAQLRRSMTHQSQRLHPASIAETEATLNVDDGNFDFEKVLRSAMRKLDESDIQRRELGVMFKDLAVSGLGATAKYKDSVGSAFDPRVIMENIRSARHPPVRDILSGFNGVVRPGEMLLVLGRPGSGCSTLLKTLANQRQEYHSVRGEVHYDSLTPEKLAAHYRGDVVYCPEDDVHFPTLTVDQTLQFAAKTRIPRTRINNRSQEQYVRDFVDILETIFGLRHVKDTQVGDARIRGVSGGQKKRVSIAEALATRCLIGAWDNSTRGLDASTALEFVRALRIATDVARVTTVVSIYQAGEQLYELFDKVCVIYEGKMAYYGPANQARQYFIDMGYQPVDRQTTADFLVAVTDPNGRSLRPGLSVPVPGTAEEFAEHFRRSALGAANEEDMASYREEFTGKQARADAYKVSAQAERGKHARKESPYTISVMQQTRAVMTRRVQIIKGDLGTQAIQLFSFVFQGIIVGTVFLQMPVSTSAFFSRGGVLFFSILFTALSSMAEIPALFGQRPIVDRHQRSAMYHPFIESLALTLVDVPITFITMVAFSILIYFLTGLQKSASQYFIFLLFVTVMTLTMKAIFRFFAAAFKSPAPAQTVAGILVLPLVLYTGYSIPKPSMIGALRWITYINPLRYGFAGVMVNEFHTIHGSCANLVPQGPGYEGVTIENQVCASVGSQAGQSTVDGNRFLSLSYGYTYSELWRDFGIVVAFGIGFLALLLIFTEKNTSLASSSSVTLFKRGAKTSAVDSASASDEESNRTATRDGNTGREDNDAIASQPKMDDVFSWQHLNYTVPVGGGETRQLLDDVSGYVMPGKLTALMGESGAGKTTLLNVLAERQGTGVVTGGRYVNGQPLPSDFQAQTGYVQQMDTHLDTTTVREALLFSARMRQPQSVPDSEKQAYVEQCLKMCGLEAYADAIVGSLGVEHRKRTTIGVELAAKPKLLLFLDEPTSGLDSQSAWSILDFMRKLADAGTAILCTIHQPSAELFSRFDRLLLLKRGGKTVYFGDLGENTNTLISYFERNGGRNIENGENPAEYMLEVIGAGATANSDIEWHDVWTKSAEAQETQREIEQIHEDGRKRPAVQAAMRSEFATSWMYQLQTLLVRSARSYWRDTTYISSKILLNIASGLFIGFTFWQAKDTQQGTQNKLFAIFMGTILAVTMANQLQVPFINLRSIYEIRERPSRMYSWTAMITAQILVELPWNVLSSTLFYLCWYWTVGFPNDRAGFTYLLLGVAFPLYYTTIGQAVASMAPNAEIAALLFSLIFSFVLTFNGVMQPFSQLGWWRWMYRVSPFTYLISALLGQAIGKQELNCSAVEFVTLNPPNGSTCASYMEKYISLAGGYLSNPEATSSCQYCASRTTDEFLGRSFNIYYKNHWWQFGVFCAYIVFNVAAIYALTWLFRMRTGSLLGAIKTRLAKRK